MIFILSKIFLLALVGFTLGMLNPDWGIFWGDYSDKSRKNVIKYYGSVALASLLLGIVLVDEPSKIAKDIVQAEKIEYKEIKNYQIQQDEKLSELKPKKLVQDNNFTNNIEQASHFYFKDFEKIKDFKFSLGNIQVFQEEPIKDNLGTEFKYSFLIDGYYQLENEEEDKNFSMLIVYRDEEELNQGLASCIKYDNDNTGIHFNALEK